MNRSFVTIFEYKNYVSLRSRVIKKLILSIFVVFFLVLQSQVRLHSA